LIRFVSKAICAWKSIIATGHRANWRELRSKTKLSPASARHSGKMLHIESTNRRILQRRCRNLEVGEADRLKLTPQPALLRAKRADLKRALQVDPNNQQRTHPLCSPLGLPGRRPQKQLVGPTVAGKATGVSGEFPHPSQQINSAFFPTGKASASM